MQHMVFVVPTRGAVHAVHGHVVNAGSTILHPPRGWPQYHRPTHPFGIMLEAVCHHDRD